VFFLVGKKSGKKKRGRSVSLGISVLRASFGKATDKKKSCSARYIYWQAIICLPFQVCYRICLERNFVGVIEKKSKKKKVAKKKEDRSDIRW
jgi:hypothetical protein